MKGQEYLETRCGQVNDNNMAEIPDLERELFQFIKDFDNQVSNVNKNMCTKNCPCFKSE